MARSWPVVVVGWLVVAALLGNVAACRKGKRVPPERAVHLELKQAHEDALNLLRSGEYARSGARFDEIQGRLMVANEGMGRVEDKPVDGKTRQEWFDEWRQEYRREVGRHVEAMARAVADLKVTEQEVTYLVNQHGTPDDVALLQSLAAKARAGATVAARDAILLRCESAPEQAAIKAGRMPPPGGGSASLGYRLCDAVQALLVEQSKGRAVTRSLPAGATAGVELTVSYTEDTVFYGLSNQGQYPIVTGIAVTFQGTGTSWGAGKTAKASARAPSFSKPRGGAAPVDEMERARSEIGQALLKDVVEQMRGFGAP